MKEHVNYFCFGFLVCLIFVALVDGCHNKKEPKQSEEIKTDSIKKVISDKKEDVAKDKKEALPLEKAKSNIHYRVHWDTIPIYDTIEVNLEKCDSLNKINDLIITNKNKTIADLDTLAKGYQEEIFEDSLIVVDLKNKNLELTKEVKKEKRKLLITKIVTGIIIVLAIIAH